MDAFRADDALKSHLSWLGRSKPVPSHGAAPLPLEHPDFDDWQPVARGPRLPDTRHDDAVDAWIWQRRSEPGALWLGVGATCPPALFFRADTPARLHELLDRFFLHPPKHGERARQREAFVGIVPAMRDIENRLALDLFMHTMPLRLGTASTDERPYPEDVEQEVMLRTTMLTRHSQSLIDVFGWDASLCGLEGRIVTVRVRYDAAPDAETVRRYNGATGMELPEDLPIDVIGAFHGMPNLPPDVLRREVAADTEPTFHLALLAFVLAHEPPCAEAAVRAWAADPREDVARLAEEMSAWLAELPKEAFA